MSDDSGSGSKKETIMFWVKIAACILLITIFIFVGYYAYKSYESKDKPKEAQSSGNTQEAANGSNVVPGSQEGNTHGSNLIGNEFNSSGLFNLIDQPEILA